MLSIKCSSHEKCATSPSLLCPQYPEMFHQHLCERDCQGSMRCHVNACCRVEPIDPLLPLTRIKREKPIWGWPLLPALFFSSSDSIANWEKWNVCSSVKEFKHADAGQWKSLQQPPNPVSLKVRTQWLRMPPGESEMADLNKTFPSIGKPQHSKGNEELQQMWHLYFSAPTCLFFESLFRAL